MIRRIELASIRHTQTILCDPDTDLSGHRNRHAVAGECWLLGEQILQESGDLVFVDQLLVFGNPILVLDHAVCE